MSKWIDELEERQQYLNQHRHHRNQIFGPLAQRTWEALVPQIQGDVADLNKGHAIRQSLLNGEILINEQSSRVSIAVAKISSEIMEPELKTMISGTTFGPGKVRVSIIRCDSSSFLSRLRRIDPPGFLIHDYKNPLSGQLPITLDTGERVDLIPFEKDCVFLHRPTRVELRDNFGRDHWAPRKLLRRAQARYDRTSVN